MPSKMNNTRHPSAASYRKRNKVPSFHSSASSSKDSKKKKKKDDDDDDQRWRNTAAGTG
jgi:hypothetical protein